MEKINIKILPNEKLKLKQILKKYILEYGFNSVLNILEEAVEDSAISNEEAFKLIDLSILKENKKAIDESSKNTKKRISFIANHFGLEVINGRCICPFHNGADNKTSFSLNDKTNTFYCFSCGVKGDVFTFIKMMREKYG